MRRPLLLIVVAASLVAAATAVAATARTGRSEARLTVLAASSLTEVFPGIDPAPRYSFGGSDLLAAQIEQGAPADVFAAASPKYPAILYRKGLVLKPLVFATNRLVLITPASNPARIHSVFDLRRKGDRLVIGDGSVPIGTYTRQVLARLGLTRVLADVVSNEQNVRDILAKVALGEADAGFVYVTDARTAAARLKTIALPARSQPVVFYEIAVARSSKSRSAASAFVREVLSKRGERLLAAAGFGSPGS
jgi:molybdate transport system substrate-binding protein